MSALHRDCVADEYERKRPIFAALKQEVRYVLEQEIADKQLKVHAIEDRIKTLESVLAKAEGKALSDPLRELIDIVGVRVVVLFRSDLPALDEIIRRSFNVITVDDKLTSGDGLGYASVHYECQMRSEYSGPRYRRIGGITFEVQVRTICMHAWAVISHYLDYKGEWDVPDHLKRALNALSGLFYVADNEFEVVARAKVEHTRGADRSGKIGQTSERVDLDTVMSYLKRRFPDREQVEPGSVSAFVQDIVEAGYETIAELDEAISKGEEQSKSRPVSQLYSALATARLQLAYANDDYFKKMYGHQGREELMDMVAAKPRRRPKAKKTSK
jgi:GTP pyrophosphokinase